MRLSSIRKFALVLCLAAGGLGAGSDLVRPRAALAAPEHTKGYAMGSTPAWVLPHSAAVPSPRSAAREEDGDLVHEIIDDQIAIQGRGVEHYMRRVRRIVAAPGVERAGEIEISVDPAYERLVLHELFLVRDGARIDALKKATIRVAQAESGRDARIYDGSITVIIILADLRVGDTIDASWTVAGQNPVFGGRYTARLWMADRRPMRHRRVRVLWPQGRPLAYRASVDTIPKPATRLLEGGVTETVWEQADVPADIDEDDMPSWFESATLSLSEFASWGEVAAWAAPLYREGQRPSPALQAKIDEIAARYASPEARAQAALRFVQDDIRYLGMELGEHSHRPHDASLVFDQRFGDCKDKTTLLLTMLRRLGIEADGALVHTGVRGHLEDRLPTPYAFNHVIVRMRIGGREQYVDPTISLQRGAADSIPLPYERALITVPESAGLAVIPAPKPSRPTTIVRETYWIEGDDARLEVETTVRDGEASETRERYAGSSRDEIRKNYLNFYSKYYPEIESAGPISVEDDEAADVITVREQYRVHHVMKDGVFQVVPHNIVSNLAHVGISLRKAPFALSHPQYLREEVEIRGARFQLPEDVVVHDPTITFTARTQRGAAQDSASFVFEYRTHRDSVPAAEVGAYMKTLDAVLDGSHPRLRYVRGESPEERKKNTYTLLTFLGFVSALGLGTVVSKFVSGRRRRTWSKKSRADQGDTPARAVSVLDRGHATKLLVERRCDCGTALAAPESIVWTELWLGDQAITAGRIPCPQCGRARVRYFKVDDVTARQL